MIANIFGLETANSPLGAVYAISMVLMFIGFCLKILKDHKEKLTETQIPVILVPVSAIFYFLIVVLSLVLAIFVFVILPKCVCPQKIVAPGHENL